MAGLHQVITYHLDDSLPADALARMVAKLEAIADDGERQRQQRRNLETLIDAGHGSCLLRDPACAQVVVEAWRHFADIRYDLCAWVVMPNHVHVLIRERHAHPLAEVVATWKSFTAHAINRLIGRSGRLWHPDYWDRYIRDERHYAQAMAYIESNPVAAGLCQTPADWPWSSAGCRNL